MITGTDTGDDDAELFLADFHPGLGEYLAERHAGGYDTVAARARFVIWLATHTDKSAIRPPPADPDTSRTPVDATARDALTARIAQAREVRELDAADIAELGRRIAAGREAEDRLRAAYLRLVVSIAERYAGRGVPFLDLVEAGTLGLLRAAGKFDDGRGYPFSAYATWWIRQAINRAVAGKAHAARIPAHLAETISQITIIERRLARELGREPTPEELAAELGTSPD